MAETKYDFKKYLVGFTPVKRDQNAYKHASNLMRFLSELETNNRYNKFFSSLNNLDEDEQSIETHDEEGPEEQEVENQNQNNNTEQNGETTNTGQQSPSSSEENAETDNENQDNGDEDENQPQDSTASYTRNYHEELCDIVKSDPDFYNFMHLYGDQYVKKISENEAYSNRNKNFAQDLRILCKLYPRQEDYTDISKYLAHLNETYGTQTMNEITTLLSLQLPSAPVSDWIHSNLGLHLNLNSVPKSHLSMAADWMLQDYLNDKITLNDPLNYDNEYIRAPQPTVHISDILNITRPIGQVIKESALSSIAKKYPKLSIMLGFPLLMNQANDNN